MDSLKVYRPNYRVRRTTTPGLYFVEVSRGRNLAPVCTYIKRVARGSRNFYVIVGKATALMPTLRDAIVHIAFGLEG